MRRGARTVLTAATGAVAFAALTAACSSSAQLGKRARAHRDGGEPVIRCRHAVRRRRVGRHKQANRRGRDRPGDQGHRQHPGGRERARGRQRHRDGIGTGGSGSQPVTFDLTLVKNVGCQGTLALSKTETFQLVETGGYVWILPSSAYYQSLHLDKAALALMADKYIKVKSTDKQIGDLGQECTFTGLLGSLSKPTGSRTTRPPR